MNEGLGLRFFDRYCFECVKGSEDALRQLDRVVSILYGFGRRGFVV